MSAKENEGVIHSYLEVVHTGNLELISEVISPDYVLYDSNTDEVGKGQDTVNQTVNMLRSAFPDLRIEVKDLIAQGDKVVLRWVGNGTHRGEWGGISPTNKSVTLKGTTICRLEDGKIVEEWRAFGAMGLMAQLGTPPA